MYRVAVTGLGILSPLGRGLEANALAVFVGKDAVAPLRGFDASQFRCQSAAEINEEWIDPAPARGRRWHRSSMVLATALREAMLSAGQTFRPDYAVVGTTSGGMSYGEAFYRGAAAGLMPARADALMANYLPHKPVADALDLCDVRAPAQIIATACASGADAIGLGMERVRRGLSRQVLAGGYDLLCELVFAGFDVLQALTTERCRPFDIGRSGLVLGEAAAFLALESFDSAVSRGATILCEAAGYGCASDTHHPTQPEPGGKGPMLAMTRALKSAGLAPGGIDYVNAHGTATTFNDEAEARAIGRVFSERAAPMPVSSTKSMTGHTLGAAGAIEAVYSILALREQRLPPNINHSEADPAWRLRVVANRAESASVSCVLSNSLGFGGTNASLIFKTATK